MEKITSLDVLGKDIDRCSKAFDDKVKGVGGKRAVMVCGGTGCLANDSDAILHEFEKQIKEKGLEREGQCQPRWLLRLLLARTVC
jgi:hypothetical protein